MPNSLLELEAERSNVLRQLTTLGDLRTGSICAVPRRCGKTDLPLLQAKGPGARSPDSPDTQSRRKNCGRIVSFSLSLAEGTGRNR